VLSPDGSLIAYTRRDRSGLPHLFVVDADGTGNLQLTHGSRYVDSSPSWAPGDSTDITYERQSVRSRSHRLLLGKPRRWSISVDGSGNTPW
jgi:Tol biopolymer transport system component